MKQLGNAFLVVFSVLFASALAEGATRIIDGLPVFTDWLPQTVDRDLSTSASDGIPRAAGVDRAWFLEDPPPLPNRHRPPEEWMRIMREVGEGHEWNKPTFHHFDFFKAWNAVAIGNPCDSDVLRQAPGRLYVYDPADGLDYPRFRFLPGSTTPAGLVTNAMGWRGPPIELDKQAGVVRIAFVGASTTVNSHFYPYSYPELVVGWLNRWAATQKRNVRFEVINAGREGVNSRDIAAIVRKEVLPFHPDVVVYYEGANQFALQGLLKARAEAPPTPPPAAAPERGLSLWLRDASNRSAIARRLQSALGMARHPGNGAEWPKPPYEIAWPAGLDEANPDITRKDLPVNLPIILSDLDGIDRALREGGSELVLSSFKWLVHDGMAVDPVYNKGLIEHLNVGEYPFRYRDIERMAAFQNRVLAKFAAARGLPFIDIAGAMPDRPDLYTDAIHFTYGGVRLHAWIALQALVPLIEKRLADGAWPRPAGDRQTPPPGLFFTPREIAVSCPKR